METETDKQLSFIDIFISNVNNSFSENYKCFSENYIYIYRTFIKLYFNYSFTSCIYKIWLIKCLIDWENKMNYTWIKLNEDFINIKNTLKRNSYRTHRAD